MAELDRLGAMQPETDLVPQELVDDVREVFGTEYCMVNLVTADTQFFKAWSGEMPPEVAAVRRAPRERTMCRHVVEDEQQLVVEDFSTTERFREQHLRMGPGIRFYAGNPLETSEGHAVGSLSLVDSRPRRFDDKDKTTLRAFARAVVGRLEVLGAAAHEREAKESERQYRQNVFELANEAILIYGAETGLFLDANRRACEMYGLSQESLVGERIAELSLEPEGEEGYVREVLRSGAHRGFETVHLRADGTPIDVSINSSVTEYGGQQAILSIVRDVTGRKRTEEALRESEEGLAQAHRIAHIGNWEYELGRHRAHWSDEMYRIFGFAPLSSLPSYKAFIFFVHPDDKERVRGSIRGALYGDGPEDIEYRIVRPDGEVRHVHTQYEVARDEGGRPTKFVGTVQDVTDRKRGERKLEAAEEQYRLLVEQIPAVTYVQEASGHEAVRYVSPQMETMLGYAPEECVSDPGHWIRILHPDDRERVLAANDRSNATGEPFDEEYRMITRDGRVVWLHDATVVLRGAENRPSYRQGVMYDVTERRQTEEALHASKLRMRTVIEHSPLSIHIFAPDGTSLLTNGAWDELWYLSAEEAASEGNVFEDEQLLDARLIRYIERSAEEGAAVVAPLLLFDPANTGREGRPRLLRTLIYPVKGEDGRVLETVLLLEDLTERKRAEDALEESEDCYRAVVEQSAEAIWMFDPETKRVLEANAAFQEMLGYDAEELRAMTNYDFVAHSREDVDRTVGDKIREEGSSRLERKYRMKNGELLDVEVGGP